jgi:murein DD-endopeptidase MepM/ murein hydrolase activator NlpD
MNPVLFGALAWTFLLPVPLLTSPTNPPAPAAPPAVRAPQPSALWPLDPRPAVVHGFDLPRQRWSAGHRGVDLLGTAGQPVRAALPGTVTFAGTIAGRGVVVVTHGDSRTTYEPVRAAVRRGDQVDAGGTLGRLQSGLSHCAPRSCLHWGLVRRGEYADPLGLLAPGRLRLLPFHPDASRI